MLPCFSFPFINGIALASSTEQSICVILSQFPSKPNGSVYFGHLNFLADLYGEIGQTSILTLVTNTFVQAYKISFSTALQQDAMQARMYGRVLRAVQGSLVGLCGGVADDMILAIWLLGIYEVSHCDFYIGTLQVSGGYVPNPYLDFCFIAANRYNAGSNGLARTHPRTRYVAADEGSQSVHHSTRKKCVLDCTWPYCKLLGCPCLGPLSPLPSQSGHQKLTSDAR